MRIILLMGTSSVGKSALCQALREIYQFHVVKNGDEYLTEHLNSIHDLLEKNGVTSNLTPPMRADEIMQFCLTQQLNISQATPPLKDHKVNDISELEEILVMSGYDEEISAKLAANLRIAKKIFDEIHSPTYEESLEKSFTEALDLSNQDKTIVIDLVPEATPDKTQEVLETFKARATAFGNEHDIEIRVDQVLLYCPLELLSENMAARNRKAEDEKNIVNKRTGINSLLMFTSVATADDQPTASENNKLFPVSKQEIREMITKHSVPKDVEQLYQQIIGQGDGKWFHGFRFPDDKDKVMLRVPSELQFDLGINNSGNKSMATLAGEIVTKLNIDVMTTTNLRSLGTFPAIESGTLIQDSSTTRSDAHVKKKTY